MRNPPKGTWAKALHRDPPDTPLMRELCRLFNAKPHAMMCCLRTGQVSIDGRIVRERHLDQWTPDQLRGRYVGLFLRRFGQLYGTKQVG